MDEVTPIAAFSKENNPNVRVLNNGYTLSNLKTLLSVARANNFGVVAINQRSKYIVEATLEAAWQEKSPVICEIAESESKYCNMGPDRLSNLVHEGIERMIEKYGYSVPVALHMDHVQKDLELVDRAIEAGFSSVEADLSRFPVQENIEKSKPVVEKCHRVGVSVELEEGEIGAAGALSDPNIDSNIESYYTKVEDAKALVSAARPDALAIFVGNGHGKYLKEPRIGFDRIAEIWDAIKEYDCPVVLHGGSGLSPETFNKAIDAGAAKVNYATSVSDIFFKNLPEELIAEMDKKAEENDTARRKVLYLFEEQIDGVDSSMLEKAKEEMIEHIKMMMREGFRSNGKADMYE